ncbi:unnamed protein product, partial [Cladocopium goreaui]
VKCGETVPTPKWDSERDAWQNATWTFSGRISDDRPKGGKVSPLHDSDSENNSEPSWWIPSDEEDDQGEDNPEEPPSVMAAFDSLPPVPAAPESHGTTQPAKKTPKQRREVDRPYHQFTVGSRAAKRRASAHKGRIKIVECHCLLVPAAHLRSDECVYGCNVKLSEDSMSMIQAAQDATVLWPSVRYSKYTSPSVWGLAVHRRFDVVMKALKAGERKPFLENCLKLLVQLPDVTESVPSRRGG